MMLEHAGHSSRAEEVLPDRFIQQTSANTKPSPTMSAQA
jgi:hypothetical protein